MTAEVAPPVGGLPNNDPVGAAVATGWPKSGADGADVVVWPNSGNVGVDCKIGGKHSGGSGNAKNRLAGIAAKSVGKLGLAALKRAHMAQT